MTSSRRPGTPKSDKLDAVSPTRLTERGMLRPPFVPPAEIRYVRDYTRLRTELTRERTPLLSAGKLLEDADREPAQAVIVEISLHMSTFPTPGHLVSWVKLSPRTMQSGGHLGCAAAAANSSSNLPVVCGSSIIGVCPTPGSSSTRAPGTTL